MNTSLWHQELLRAANPHEVLSSTLDYLALWRPDELGQLPEPLDAAMLATPEDISTYATALLAHQREGRASAAREALTAFFTIAERRLAELSAAAVASSVRPRQPAETVQA